MTEQTEIGDSGELLHRGAELVTRIIELAGLELEVQTVEDNGSGRILLKGTDAWAISGRHEETITALQHLIVCALCGPDRGSGPTVQSAVRESGRDAKLGGLAASLGALAKASSQIVAVDLMSQADRRALHQGLAEIGGLESFGAGDGAYRRLVVRPRKREQGPKE